VEGWPPGSKTEGGPSGGSFGELQRESAGFGSQRLALFTREQPIFQSKLTELAQNLLFFHCRVQLVWACEEEINLYAVLVLSAYEREINFGAFGM
jgi:hypothetical protein